jgi:hypothetical protein
MAKLVLGDVHQHRSDDLERHWSGYGLERARHLLYGRTNFLFNKG